jgi:hypothetical protein
VQREHVGVRTQRKTGIGESLGESGEWAWRWQAGKRKAGSSHCRMTNSAVKSNEMQKRKRKTVKRVCYLTPAPMGPGPPWCHQPTVFGVL